MFLTEKEFEEIKCFYDGEMARTLFGAGDQLLLLDCKKIQDISLNGEFESHMSFEDCHEYIVLQYKSKLSKECGYYTFSPEPGEQINKSAWRELMKDELQNNIDRDLLIYKFILFKKALLALDLSNRYDAWGTRMYEMFKDHNLKHAQYFLKNNCKYNTWKMLAEINNYLSEINLRLLDIKQREFCVKLMLYAVDKQIVLSEIYSVMQEESIKSRNKIYQTIKNTGIPELIQMLPPEYKIESSYLSQAASFIYEFLPGFTAQQSDEYASDQIALQNKLPETRSKETKKLR